MSQIRVVGDKTPVVIRKASFQLHALGDLLTVSVDVFNNDHVSVAIKAEHTKVILEGDIEGAIKLVNVLNLAIQFVAETQSE